MLRPWIDRSQGLERIANPMCRVFRCHPESSEGSGAGGYPTPDASPLRLAQHDISAQVDEHVQSHEMYLHMGLASC